MIIVAIRAGLGGQMFCYALGRTLVERSDEQVKFHDRSTWDIFIESFETNIEFASNSELDSVMRSRLCRKVMLEWGKKRRLEGSRLLANQFPACVKAPAKLCNFYIETKPTDTPDGSEIDWPQRRRFYQPILDINDDSYLFGHWQSPKYFESIRDTLIDEFQIKRLTGKNDEVANKIDSTNSIGIHVRRGAAARRGNALPASYYEKAAKFVTRKLSKPHFFVFSGQPQWAEDNLSLEHPTTYITHNGPDQPHFDMELLKRCDHQISSASTFSWWGAWLNDNENKIVTLPNPWKRYGYSQKRVETWEYFPEQWKFIKY